MKNNFNDGVEQMKNKFNETAKEDKEWERYYKNLAFIAKSLDDDEIPALKSREELQEKYANLDM